MNTFRTDETNGISEVEKVTIGSLVEVRGLEEVVWLLVADEVIGCSVSLRRLTTLFRWRARCAKNSLAPIETVCIKSFSSNLEHFLQ